MANRAYLYSVNEIPDGTNQENIKIVGLSEFNYDIPLAFKILLGANTQITQSIIFEEKIGITGNYEEGVDYLRKYLDIFKKESVPNREKFDDCYKNTFDFLNNSKNKQKYLQLEIGEILDLGGDFDETVNEIKDWGKKLIHVPKSTTLASGPNAERVVAQLMNDWELSLGIDYWENTLYFDFDK